MPSKLLLAAPLAALCLALAGCVGGDEPAAPAAAAEPETVRVPLWRLAPDKAPGPAVAAVVGRRESFALRTVARGLREPVQVVARPGDDRLYVAERAGRVRVVEDGRLVGRPFLDIRDRVRDGAELGLLTMVFDREGDRLFVMYTDRNEDTRVEFYPAGPDRAFPQTATELLHVRQPYENHKGGTLLLDGRGRLLLGLGDGGSAFDPQQRGQDEGEPLGGLLRREEDRWKTVAIGLRNPWRMAIDRATGLLWLGDVGQDRMEEVDAVRLPEEGLLNFGWAAYEGRMPLGRKRLNPKGRLVWPIAAYTHETGCSVTGGLVYRGAAVPALLGRYVYADFCSGAIWSLRAAAATDGGSADLRRERVTLPGVVSFGTDHDGEAYALTIDGHLARLVSAGGPRNSDDHG